MQVEDPGRSLSSFHHPSGLVQDLHDVVSFHIVEGDKFLFFLIEVGR